MIIMQLFNFPIWFKTNPNICKYKLSESIHVGDHGATLASGAGTNGPLELACIGKSKAFSGTATFNSPGTRVKKKTEFILFNWTFLITEWFPFYLRFSLSWHQRNSTMGSPVFAKKLYLRKNRKASHFWGFEFYWILSKFFYVKNAFVCLSVWNVQNIFGTE